MHYSINCIKNTVLFIFAFLLAGCSPSVDSKSISSNQNTPDIPKFNQERAFELLKKQVEIGARYPGSKEHKLCAQFIQNEVSKYAERIEFQKFTHEIDGKTLEMSNIIAYFNTRAKNKVLLAAHWDTRPTADMEVVPEKRKKPILGANDGASGTAVLLEMARMFSVKKPDVGIVMVFFDGEDYGPNMDNMFLGSKEFSKRYKNKTPQDKPIYGILLDMVGDKDLKIYQEQISAEAAPEIVNKVWRIAKELGYEKTFVPEVKYSVYDDHVPLIDAGIKCIDIIDFEYGPWHTLDDTIDKCSAESLGIVGEVVAHVVYRENQN